MQVTRRLLRGLLVDFNGANASGNHILTEHVIESEECNVHARVLLELRKLLVPNADVHHAVLGIVFELECVVIRIEGLAVDPQLKAFRRQWRGRAEELPACELRGLLLPVVHQQPLIQITL